MRRERVVPVAVAAVTLVAVGLVVGLWRPYAPAVGTVITDLDDFAPSVLAAVDGYRGPVLAGAVLRLLLSVLVPVSVLVVPAGRRLVRRLAGPSPAGVWRAGLVGVAIAALTSLAMLPVSIWTGYVHAGRWGFRTAGPLLWARDWLLGAALGWLVVGVSAAAVLWVVRRWPASWHWRLVIAGTAATAGLVLVHPLVIQPLFLPTRPLTDPAVRAEVEQVLAAAGEGDLEILVGDASSRTTRVNALVTGIGPSRRVILYDNLLELPVDQVGLVVAHELAHREHRDVARGVLLSGAGILFVLLVLRAVWRAPSARRLVDARTPADPRLVAVGVAVVAAAQLVGQPVVMLVSRQVEAAADHRALVTSGDAAALIRTNRIFTVRDLAMPEPPGWVWALWGTHPGVGERIRAAVAHARREGIELPSLAELRADEDGRRHPRIAERLDTPTRSIP